MPSGLVPYVKAAPLQPRFYSYPFAVSQICVYLRPSSVEVFSSRPFVSIRGLVSQFAVAFGSLLLSLRYGNIDY